MKRTLFGYLATHTMSYSSISGHMGDRMLSTTGDDDIQASLQNLREAARYRSDSDAFVVTLVREMTEIVSQHQPLGGALSADQAEYLVESNAFTRDELAETEASVRRGELAEAVRATRLGVIVDSLNEAEAAVRLGVDVARARELGELYSFATGSEQRYPSWQFTGDPVRPVLPHLASIVHALHSDTHPAGVQGFMTTPQQGLRREGRLTRPIERLLQGGN